MRASLRSSVRLPRRSLPPIGGGRRGLASSRRAIDGDREGRPCRRRREACARQRTAPADRRREELRGDLARLPAREEPVGEDGRAVGVLLERRKRSVPLRGAGGERGRARPRGHRIAKRRRRTAETIIRGRVASPCRTASASRSPARDRSRSPTSCGPPSTTPTPATTPAARRSGSPATSSPRRTSPRRSPRRWPASSPWTSPSCRIPVDFVEVGAGDGRFLEDFSQALRVLAPSVHDRLRLTAVEASAAGRSTLAARAIEPAPRILSSVEELAEGSVTGWIFSNELFDALPVARVMGSEEGLRELRVGFEDGRFVWVPVPAGEPLRRHLEAQGIALAPGQKGEISPELADLQRRLARALARGWLVAFDYGHPARILYHPLARPEGTLAVHAGGRRGGDPLEDPGAHDLTAHVNWDVLLARRRGGRSPHGSSRAAGLLPRRGRHLRLRAQRSGEVAHLPTRRSRRHGRADLGSRSVQGSDRRRDDALASRLAGGHPEGARPKDPEPDRHLGAASPGSLPPTCGRRCLLP